MDDTFPVLTESQLNRVIQSCGDFQQALSALTFLLDECSFSSEHSRAEIRKFRCYEDAAIVAFARPFEVSRGRIILGLRATGVQLSPSDQELKSKIIDLRRKVVAHSDDDSMHFKISTTGPIGDSAVTMPILLFNESLRLDLAEVQELHALLRKLVHGLANLLFLIAQRQPERLNLYKLPVG